jgi:hypothetical protein
MTTSVTGFVRWDSKLQLIAFAAALCSSACGSDDGQGTTPSGTGSIEPGVLDAEGGWVFRTEAFTLGPGEERFICYAADAQADLSVRRFTVSGKPMIHHFLMSTVRCCVQVRVVADIHGGRRQRRGRHA